MEAIYSILIRADIDRREHPITKNLCYLCYVYSLDIPPLACSHVLVMRSGSYLAFRVPYLMRTYALQYMDYSCFLAHLFRPNLRPISNLLGFAGVLKVSRSIPHLDYGCYLVSNPMRPLPILKRFSSFRLSGFYFDTYIP